MRISDWSSDVCSSDLDWPSPAKIAICLVLHQVGLEEKARLLREAWQVVAPGGKLYVADYGEQRSRLMRLLFRLTIQQLDGVQDTQPNADGLLPVLMREAGFSDVRDQIGRESCRERVCQYV